MYECFHCGARAVIWDSDYDFDDFALEGGASFNVCTVQIAGQRLNT